MKIPRTTRPNRVALGTALLVLAASFHTGCASKSNSASVSAVIGPSGGTLTMPDGSSLEVPPGALPSPTTLTMTATTLPSTIAGSTVGPKVIGQAYEFSPQGLLFAVSPVLTIAFTPTQLGSYRTSQIALLTMPDGTTDHAYVLGTSTAIDESHVSAALAHFSEDFATIWVNGPLPCGSGGAACVSFVSTLPCPAESSPPVPASLACPSGSSGGSSSSGAGSGSSSGNSASSSGSSSSGPGSSSGSGTSSGSSGGACTGLSCQNFTDNCFCGACGTDITACALYDCTCCAAGGPPATGTCDSNPVQSCPSFPCCVSFTNGTAPCCQCYSDQTIAYSFGSGKSCTDLVSDLMNNEGATNVMMVPSCPVAP